MTRAEKMSALLYIFAGASVLVLLSDLIAGEQLNAGLVAHSAGAAVTITLLSAIAVFWKSIKAGYITGLIFTLITMSPQLGEGFTRLLAAGLMIWGLGYLVYAFVPSIRYFVQSILKGRGQD
jgi:hypothetical protein